MWFTRVSIANPVMAVMVMLAFVVLGLFSYQRLKVDQFPDIDFPTVVVQMDYPGASPEIVEAEVTKKVEESVNTIAGIRQLYSRSYEGSSVVIIQFNLDVDGRKAADDVREKVAMIKPLLRDEVKDAAHLALRPLQPAGLQRRAHLARRQPQRAGAHHLGHQVLQEALENVRGVGSVTVVGGVKREINVHLRPQAAGSAGRGRRPGRVRAAQREPGTAAGRPALARGERVVQINAR
jgi:HAE1 family hydrophobic/amphiphilic exporter-1